MSPHSSSSNSDKRQAGRGRRGEDVMQGRRWQTSLITKWWSSWSWLWYSPLYLSDDLFQLGRKIYQENSSNIWFELFKTSSTKFQRIPSHGSRAAAAAAAVVVFSNGVALVALSTSALNTILVSSTPPNWFEGLTLKLMLCIYSIVDLLHTIKKLKINCLQYNVHWFKIIFQFLLKLLYEIN